MVPGALRRGSPLAARAQELRAGPGAARLTQAAAVAIELLRRGERLRIRARGASMLPFVRDRDVVEVAPAALDHLRHGDLVCYESEPGVLRIHRLLARDPSGLLVRGDALPHAERVSLADVLGAVVAIERGGRRRPFPRRLALLLAPLLGPIVDLALSVRRARTVDLALTLLHARHVVR